MFSILKQSAGAGGWESSTISPAACSPPQHTLAQPAGPLHPACRQLQPPSSWFVAFPMPGRTLHCPPGLRTTAAADLNIVTAATEALERDIDPVNVVEPTNLLLTQLFHFF